MIIALEGIDGCGKTSVWHALLKKGFPAFFMSEPYNHELFGDGGCKLDGLSAGEQLDLFIADRKEMWPDQKKCKNPQVDLVLDRSLYSSCAYQSFGDGPPWKQILSMHGPECVYPDLVFYLEIPLELALERIASRKGEATAFERKDRLEHAAKTYRTMGLIRNTPERKYSYWKTLDGTQPVEENVLIIEDRIALVRSWGDTRGSA